MSFPQKYYFLEFEYRKDVTPSFSAHTLPLECSGLCCGPALPDSASALCCCLTVPASFAMQTMLVEKAFLCYWLEQSRGTIGQGNLSDHGVIASAFLNWKSPPAAREVRVVNASYGFFQKRWMGPQERRAISGLHSSSHCKEAVGKTLELSKSLGIRKTTQADSISQSFLS